MYHHQPQSNQTRARHGALLYNTNAIAYQPTPCFLLQYLHWETLLLPFLLFLFVLYKHIQQNVTLCCFALQFELSQTWRFASLCKTLSREDVSQILLKFFSTESLKPKI